ncbi:MAG: hypothetical protein IJ769_13165, partial [Clostridia bacterium]|nr:hypothetical protein [Clostridia bacterium]
APAVSKPGSRAAKAAAMTHEERVAVIAGQIERRLKGHDKVQVSNLFPSLNQLAEYRVDKRDAGKKPLNYLTSTFGELFHFEEAADGQSWVSLSDASPQVTPAEAAAPAAEAEPAEIAPTEAEAPAEPAQAQASVEAKPRAARSRRAKAAEPAPIAEEPAAETPAVEAADEAPDPLSILISEGIPEDVARQIAEIFTESASLREAYNKLRSVFGNTAGRDYYQQVKDIASRQ